MMQIYTAEILYTKTKSPSRMFRFSSEKTDLLSSGMQDAPPTDISISLYRYYYGNQY